MVNQVSWAWLAEPRLVPLWGSIALAGLWLGLVVFLAEWLYRNQWAGPEVGRKIVHMGTGNVIFLAWGLAIPAWVGLVAAIGAGSIAIVSYFLPILPSVNGVGRKTFGTFFYAVSVGVTIAIFWPLGQPVYAVLGIAVMAWGDGLAAIVGKTWGRHRYQVLGQDKSWEGSLAMFLVSAVLAVGLLGSVLGWSAPILAIALIVAVAATGLEAISNYGLDNLTVPLGSAAIAYWLTTLTIA